MEFRTPDDITTTTSATTTAPTTTMTFNQTSQIRSSAFSKPTLSPSSSLILSPRTNFLSSSSTRNNNNNNNNGNCFELPHTSSSPSPSPAPPAPVLASTSPVKYRECLRNHAASIGGHVVDGCGEFMPSETESMKCAACGCHRSFHRKDDYRLSNGGLRRRGRSSSHVPLLLPPPLAPNNPHLGSSATESSSEELNAAGQTHSAAAVQQPKKRFRTKFTAEQKEKMLAFSERVGWRIQRQDEAIVEQFCAEAGVKRQVLKVWMHNNKNTVRKQLQQPQQQQQQQE